MPKKGKGLKLNSMDDDRRREETLKVLSVFSILTESGHTPKSYGLPENPYYESSFETKSKINKGIIEYPMCDDSELSEVLIVLEDNGIKNVFTERYTYMDDNKTFIRLLFDLP